MKLSEIHIDLCRYIFDLHKKMPFHDLSEARREELWDDGLHFSDKGYEEVGKLVAERILGILERKEGKIEKGYEVVVKSRFVEVEDGEEDDSHEKAR